MNKKTYLIHSQKGQTWKNHKYIAIKNGRYIYPEDVAGEGSARQLRREAREETRKEESRMAKEGTEVKHTPSRYTVHNLGNNRKLYEGSISVKAKDPDKDSQKNWDRLAPHKGRELNMHLEELNRKDLNKAAKSHRAAEASKRQSEANIENARNVKKMNQIRNEALQRAERSKRASEIHQRKARIPVKNLTKQYRFKVAAKTLARKGKSFLASLFKKK